MAQITFNLKLILKAFQQSLIDLPQFIKQNIGLILVVSFTVEMAHHYFIFFDRMTSGATSLNALSKIGILSASLTTLIFYSMLVSLRLHPNTNKRSENFWAFTLRQTWPYFLENVRVLGKVLLWLIFGIIVAVLVISGLGAIFQDFGFNQELQKLSQTGQLKSSPTVIALVVLGLAPSAFFYLKYTFVPYIVLVDPHYEKGEVNALKTSFQLMAPILLILSLLFFGFIAFSEGLRTGFREEYSLLSSPIRAIFIYLAFETFGIFCNILLFHIYRLKQESLRPTHFTD